MNSQKRVAAIICFLLVTVIAVAQQYELRLVKKGDAELAVDMRLSSGSMPASDQYVMDIVFGIKWKEASPTELCNSFASRFNLKKAGSVAMKDGFYFQAFYAEPVGFNFPVRQMDNNWVEILSIGGLIDAPGTADFQLCEPGFDGTTEPNIRANASDNQPAVDGTAELSLMKDARTWAAPTSAPLFSIRPNPAGSLLQLLSMTPGTGEKQRCRIIDMKGAIVKESMFNYWAGGILTFDIAALPSAQYYLVVDGNNKVLFSEPFQKK